MWEKVSLVRSHPWPFFLVKRQDPILSRTALFWELQITTMVSSIPDPRYHINQNDAFSPLDLDEVQLPPSCDLSPIMVLPHRLSLLPSVCHISLSWFYIRSSMSFAITNTICHLEPFHFPVSAVQGKKQETKGMDFWHGGMGHWGRGVEADQLTASLPIQLSCSYDGAFLPCLTDETSMNSDYSGT